MVIPDEFTDEEKVTGKWWRQLAAGAGAGIGESHLFYFFLALIEFMIVTLNGVKLILHQVKFILLIV